MKHIIDIVNEGASNTNTIWVAVEVTTEDSLDRSKTHTSQRVVSYDTYLEMKDKGHTKGYASIVSLNMISPRCRNKEEAMSYIDYKTKAPRKSKIDKQGKDYIVYAINIGKLTPGGNTKFDWNLWDNIAENSRNKSVNEKLKVSKNSSNADDFGQGTEIYASTKFGGSFLIGAAGSLKKGDTLFVVDNDTQKKLTGAPDVVEAVIPVTCKEDFVKGFREAFPDRCKKPSLSFGRLLDGLPWQKFGQIYSIKGISE